MLTFRCTERVIQRFRLLIVRQVPSSTGRLGDWYANLLHVGPARFVLCQSARSLLPIILPARTSAFPGQFGLALGTVLRSLGIREALIAQELESLKDVAFARTASRQILGAMNDFADMARRYLIEEASSQAPGLRVCLKLATMPSKPIGYEAPCQLTAALFEAGKPS